MRHTSSITHSCGKGHHRKPVRGSGPQCQHERKKHSKSPDIQQRAEGETPKPPPIGYHKDPLHLPGTVTNKGSKRCEATPPCQALDKSPDCPGRPACQRDSQDKRERHPMRTCASMDHVTEMDQVHANIEATSFTKDTYGCD